MLRGTWCPSLQGEDLVRLCRYCVDHNKVLLAIKQRGKKWFRNSPCTFFLFTFCDILYTAHLLFTFCDILYTAHLLFTFCDILYTAHLLFTFCDILYTAHLLIRTADGGYFIISI